MNDKNLLDAIGGFDDRHIRAGEFNSLFEKRRPIKKFAILAVAAAALAAMSLLVGFRINRGVTVSTLKYQIKNSEPVTVELPLKAKKLKISDEIISQFEDNHYWCHTAPDELYETYGVEPLINENFIINNDVCKNMADVEILNAWGYVGYYHLRYRFFLRSVNTGARLTLEEVHFSDPDHFGLSVEMYRFEEDDIFEVLTMKDGSPGIAKDDLAFFAYNGSLYRILMDDTGEEPVTLEKVKTVLSDLGVL